MTKHDANGNISSRHDARRAGLPLRLEVKEKDQNTGTPEPYYGKTLFRGLVVFDGHDFTSPFGSFHEYADFLGQPAKRLGHKDVTAGAALWEDEE